MMSLIPQTWEKNGDKKDKRKGPEFFVFVMHNLTVIIYPSKGSDFNISQRTPC